VRRGEGIFLPVTETMGVSDEVEMVGVKKSILDVVVVQQQKRINELEEKLRKVSKKLKSLKKEMSEDQGGLIKVDSFIENKVSVAESLTPDAVDRGLAVKRGTKSSNIKKSSGYPTPSPQFSVLPRYWTEEEHRKFLEGRKLYGPKNYAAISAVVRSRTPKQVRTHAQKYEMRLVRESAVKSYAMARQMSHPAAPSPVTQDLPQTTGQDSNATVSSVEDVDLDDTTSLFEDSSADVVESLPVDGVDDLDSFLDENIMHS